MANSIYDKMFLDQEQQAKLAALTGEYNRAKAAGDRAGMDSAHAAAEDIRKSGYGYSGGGNGLAFIKLSDVYNAAKLPGYEAQTGAVNNTYNAARELQLAQLKSAYDKNAAALEEARAKIPEEYQAERNLLEGQSALSKQGFSEYAAASGLNTGTRGQAELSRMNTLQGGFTAIGKAEASALSDLDNQLAQLKLDYQNQVAQAVAQGEYERASALMKEYQTAEQSRVATAQAQADEDYRAYQAKMAADDTDYKRKLDKAKLLASTGDFSGYAALGYSAEEIARLQAAYEAGQASSGYGGYSGGSLDYGGDVIDLAESTDPAAAAAASLVAGSPAGESPQKNFNEVLNALQGAIVTGKDARYLRKMLDDATRSGMISESERQALTRQFNLGW